MWSVYVVTIFYNLFSAIFRAVSQQYSMCNCAVITHNRSVPAYLIGLKLKTSFILGLSAETVHHNQAFIITVTKVKIQCYI